MDKIKVTSWNIEHLRKVTGDLDSQNLIKRKEGIIQELNEINPDILCIVEGSNNEHEMEQFISDVFGDKKKLIKAINQDYEQRGTQYIWFVVDKKYYENCKLQPTEIWKSYTGCDNWDVNYWGEFSTKKHRYYRHPQVLLFEFRGHKIDLIGLHLKSKFLYPGWQGDWNAGGQKKEKVIREALEARIKLATEAIDVRKYINKRFEQVPYPGIFVMGDLNDGPGKELFENQYLFFDLVSNIQGDIFQADKYLNHALFDYKKNLRWSVYFEDIITPDRDPHILLDHIFFTQGLVNGKLPLQINENAGYIEHEIHDYLNSSLNYYQKTSDHKPISVVIDIAEEE